MIKFIHICLAFVFVVTAGGCSQAQKQSTNSKPVGTKQLSSQAFNSEAFETLKQEKLGERWLMVIWSLDCPACFKELKLIQKLQKAQPSKPLNVVYINVDDSDEVAFERKQVLAVYDMQPAKNYYFTEGQADKSRYQIDPNWYGELPRSYFVDEQGNFKGKSGLLDEKLIKQWLINN